MNILSVTKNILRNKLRLLSSLIIVLSGSLALAQPMLDPALLKARGIRVIKGEHLELLTDVPSSPEIDELPQVFSAAVPLWQAYFKVDAERAKSWRVRGFLMREREKFASAKLLPENLPDFLNGYALDGQLYFLEQTSDYYRRHLLLHEGTHLFQFDQAQIHSKQWYTEAIAEFLATHRWQDQKLQLGVYPDQVKEFSKWGRIELLQLTRAERTPIILSQLQQMQGRDFYPTDSYAKVWAMAAMMDQHPRYQQRFRKLQQAGPQVDFNAAWFKEFGSEFNQISNDLALFAADAVYGYDWKRNVVEYREGKAFPANTSTGRCAIQAAAGWQSSGIQLEANENYEISATGQVLLRRLPTPWPSEANGITLRYHCGQPIGTLLGMVLPANDVNQQIERVREPKQQGTYTFYAPAVLANQGTMKSPVRGTLYLKVNDSPAELQDNSGQFQIVIQKARRS